MALVLADRVVEQTTTQGTNSFELIGTADGYQAFSVVGNGSTVYYTAEGIRDDGTLTGQWEVGVGVYSAGVLSRDTILSSSTGSKVSFSAGQKNVFIDLPSEKAVVRDASDNVSGYAITGGSINNTPIGATTPSTGKFTTLIATGQSSFGGDTGSESLRVNSNAGTTRFLNATGTASGDAVLYSDGPAGSTPAVAIYARSTGAVKIGTRITNGQTTPTGTLQFQVSDTASAVNYVQVTGSATGSFPIISSQGSDTNISLQLYAKGTGAINFWTNNGGTRQLQVANATSSVNYATVSGSATTNAIPFSVAGTDTNISMAFQPKGTGAIDLAAGSSGVNISNGGTVTAITRTASGSNYTSLPSVVISAPTTAGGVQATATCSLGYGGATIVSGGTGYSVNDLLTVSGGTSTIAATLTVTSVSGGVITGITGTNAGQYTVLPSNPVSVTGGTGTGATFNLTGWFVVNNSFVITNAGSGYIEQPTVTFSGGGGGSGASAYATVGSATTLRSLAGNNTQSFSIFTPAGEALRVNDAGGTVANFVAIKASGTNSPPFVRAQGSDTNVNFAVSSQGTGSLQFMTNTVSQTQMVVSHTASAVNYVQVTGAATTAPPVISAQGSDTNIALTFTSKGTGGINFLTNNNANRSFRVAHVAGTLVNYLEAAGSATNVAPSLSAQGTDTNIDLALTPKGTGLVRFGTYTNTVSTIAGYIEIRDAGGTIRRLAVVS